MDDTLKQRLREGLDTQLGARPPQDFQDVLTRGRHKRRAFRIVTTMSMLFLGAAFLSGGLWISGTMSGDEPTTLQPSDDRVTTPHPSPSDTKESAEASEERVKLLDGEVIFRTGPWEEHAESYAISRAPMGPESLLWHETPDAGLLVLTDPAPLQGSCSRSGAAVASPQAFIEAIRSHPELSSEDPATQRIGGVDALRLDVVPAEGAVTCQGTGLIIDRPPPMSGVPVVTGTRETYFGPPLVHVLEAGQQMRLYLLDPPGDVAQSLAIVLVAAEEDFDGALKAARPVLDSFEFSELQQ